MDEAPEYKVAFGRVARSITYEDSEGQIVFTIDGSPNGANWIILEHLPSQTPRPRRYSIAFDRVKQFLESCGHQVEVYGEAESKVTFVRDMQTVIYEDSKGKLIFHFSVEPVKDPSLAKAVLHFDRGGIFTMDGRTTACRTREEQTRFAAALEKVKKHVVSHGFEIQVSSP